MSYLTCPYCGHEQEIYHDDSIAFEERNELDCESCKKTYLFVASISYSYESISAECLNDGSHDYKQSRWYSNEVECSICGSIKDKADLFGA